MNTKFWHVQILSQGSSPIEFEATMLVFDNDGDARKCYNELTDDFLKQSATWPIAAQPINTIHLRYKVGGSQIMTMLVQLHERPTLARRDALILAKLDYWSWVMSLPDELIGEQLGDD